MCDTHTIQKRRSGEHRQHISQTWKPLRIPSARKIARQHATRVTDRIRAMEKALFSVMGEIANRRDEIPPSYDRTIRETNKRDLTPQEAGEAILFASQFLTSGEITALINTLSNAGNDISDIFEQFGLQYYQDGLNHAYSEMYRIARHQNPPRFSTVRSEYFVNETSPIVRNFLNSGMERVTSRLTIDYRARLLRIIGDGLAAGGDVVGIREAVWQSIAANTHKEVGMGAAWHWQRLVRTEAQKAYALSARERAIDAGIAYERLSLANNACDWCKSARGTYELGQGPTLPIHPNCRCAWIHYYRLPRGQVVSPANQNPPRPEGA